MRNDLILTLDQEYSDYLRDESRSVGYAETISFPRSEQEIVEIVRTMDEQGIPVTVQGARTGLAAAAVPHGGHVLNMSRMNRVLGMDHRDGRYTLTVQPGLALTELRKMLSAKAFPETSGWSDASKAVLDRFGKEDEQFFSPDPTESTASIGGMTACNASGARSFFYGPTRGHIERVRLVLHDGEILEIRRGEQFATGRKAVFTTLSGKTIPVTLPSYEMPHTKNASGYYVKDDMDLIDLIIGSDGTLGVLSEVEVRLLPLPKVIWGVTSFFADKMQALDYVLRIKQNKEHLAAIESFDRNVLKLLGKKRLEGSSFASLHEVPETADWPGHSILAGICGNRTGAENSPNGL